jgi:hypothetical protein
MAEFIGMIASAYEGRDGLIEIAIDTPPQAPEGRASVRTARLFTPGEAEAMLRFAEGVNREGRNVYIGPALRRLHAPCDKRTSDADVIAARFGWADFDTEGELERALAAFEAMGAEPNWITITGEIPHWRGQCFWALTEDAPLADLRALNAAIAERFSGDASVQNVGRVMRIAGSIAWPRKPSRKRELTRALHEHTRAAPYRFDDLAMLAPKRVNGADIQHDGDAEELEPGATRDEIEALLNTLDPDMIYWDWLRVGMAVHCETGGAGWGLELWNQWSARGQKYQPGEPARKWNSFKTDRMERVTLATVRRAAAAEGRRGAEKPHGPTNGEQPTPLGDPEPLLRPMAPAEPFPVEALPEIMRAGVNGIVGRTQAPVALVAQSVIANWSLVAQGHADVETVGGKFKPLSLYILSIAKSGERKSASDSYASEAVALREAAMRKANAADAQERRIKLTSWQKAEREILADKKADRGAVEDRLRKLGPAPPSPFTPLLTCPEPTFQGLCKLLAEGVGMAGVFSAEGGQFIGGHGMKQDDKVMTATALSDVWDGEPIKRVRGGDGIQVLAGRRVALHLMVQPVIADGFVNDAMLLRQGFLPRVLIAWPESRMGQRFSRMPTLAETTDLARHTTALKLALETPLPRPPPTVEGGDPGELAPRQLNLSEGARAVLRDFSDWCEGLLAPGKLFADATMSGFGGKLAEQAARIAGVFALAENIAATEVSEATAEAAITVARWFADERLRIVEAGATDPKIALAEALRAWLFDEWQEPNIAASDVAQYGPNAARDTEKAKAALELLAARSWLEPLKGGGDVKGKKRKVAWRIRREATP